MLFWNIFVFFLLPLLVLFLTRKLSVRGMILWTAGVQVVALLLPYLLRMGFPLQKWSVN